MPPSRVAETTFLRQRRQRRAKLGGTMGRQTSVALSESETSTEDTCREVAFVEPASPRYGRSSDCAPVPRDRLPANVSGLTERAVARCRATYFFASECSNSNVTPRACALSMYAYDPESSSKRP